MISPVLIRRIDFQAGTPVEYQVQMPTKNRKGKLAYLHGLLLKVHLVLVSAATSDAITQRQFAGLVNLFWARDRAEQYAGMRQPLPGTLLRALRQAFNRDSVVKGDPTAISANSNTTNTVDMWLMLPFWAKDMKDPRQACPLAATISKIGVQWAASTIFGTGQVITAASTYCEVYALPFYADKLDSYGQLCHGYASVKSFTNDILSLRGKALQVALADLSGGATTTFGSTDFTQYDLAGKDGLEAPRQAIDLPQQALDAFDRTGLTAASLPTSGSADVVQLYKAAVGADLGDLPDEDDINVNLVVGAGAPAVSDQSYIYTVLEPVDKARWAINVGQTPNVNVSVDNARVAVSAPGGTKGNKGVISDAHPMAPFVRKTVNARVAVGRAK